MRVGTRRTAICALAVLALGLGIAWVVGFGPHAERPPGGEARGVAGPAALAENPEPGAGPGLAGAAARGAAAESPAVPPLPPPVDLETCDRDLDLFGFVLTPEGAPIAGAHLVTVTYPTRRGGLLDWQTYDTALEGPGTRSAEDGTFSVRLRRGDRVALRVSAAGRARFERPGCTAGQRLRVVLGRGVALVATLRDESGRPVAGTPVRLFRPEHAGEASFTRRVESDAEGRARFDELPGGFWAYLDPEPVTLGQVGWRRVDLPSVGEVSVEIVLPTGRTVRGRVTDAETKAPIAGARVGINWVLDRAVETNADGGYSISGWNDQQGATDLHVVATGYGRRSAVVGANETMDFALERGDTVVGRAIDGEGQPVPGAIVGVVAIGQKAGSSGGDILGTTTTDIDGRFRVPGLLRDQDHSLVIMARGLGRYLLDFAPRPGGAGEVDLGDVALPAARAIEGRVLDGAGAPVAEVPVTLGGANADRRRLLGDPPAGGASWYGQTETARTDDLGRFRFGDLAGGAYTLTAAPERGERVRRGVTLAASKDLLDADLVLTATREVVVRVREPGGAPIVGAQVSARIQNRSVGGSTALDGDAHLLLTAEAWTVDVYVPESGPNARAGAERLLRPPPQPIPATAKEVTFVLERAQPVSGIVRDPAGAPVEGAIVEALVGDRVVDTDASGADGTFSILVPAGSRVDLRVARRQMQSPAQNGAVAISLTDWTGAVLGVDAGTTGVAIEARPTELDATLIVRVVDPAGVAVRGAIVTASSVGVSATDATGEDGLATLRVSSRGSYEMLVSPKEADGGRWCAERLAQVRPEGRPLTVRLREGTVLAGTVLDADGNRGRSRWTRGRR